MAKAVSIRQANGAAKVVVDGNELHDVQSYKLECRPDAVTKLTLEIGVTGCLEVQM